MLLCLFRLHITLFPLGIAAIDPRRYSLRCCHRVSPDFGVQFGNLRGEVLHQDVSCPAFRMVASSTVAILALVEDCRYILKTWRHRVACRINHKFGQFEGSHGKWLLFAVLRIVLNLQKSTSACAT